MSNSVGAGHFVSWDGGCLLIGRAFNVTPMHAHYAIQIAFGSEHGIRFRRSEREDWTAYDGVVISSRQPHSMDSTVVPSQVVLFVEPETREGRALSERFQHGGITPLSSEELADVTPAVFSAWREQRDPAAVIQAARRVIQKLTGGLEPRMISDERVLRAVSYINSHLDESITLEDVANVACLSPSRFRHVFVEETGVALRPYVLWRRFLRVWDLMMAGESLSAAAHMAGFADAAHLTRTSRRMFGFPPSAIQIAGPLRPDQPVAVPPGAPTLAVPNATRTTLLAR